MVGWNIVVGNDVHGWIIVVGNDDHGWNIDGMGFFFIVGMRFFYCRDAINRIPTIKKTNQKPTKNTIIKQGFGN